MSQSEPRLTKEIIREMRRSYGQAGLAESDAPASPYELFHLWLSQAAANEYIVEANAMVLSTASNGAPLSRSVLLKDFSEAGFTFFTNYQSRKAQAIEINPQISLLFPWYAMERQVSIVGTAKKVSREISAEYFATRPWGSQIGAWASSQSRTASSREELESKYNEFAQKYPEGTNVPLPDHWGGYLVEATSIEFWQGRHSRLHDRLIYTKATPPGNDWSRSRLFP
jgi:pyridoxamine 5'-phosphate oxidase